MTDVGVIGAGAVGGTVASRLSQAGCDVTLYARGQRYEQLRRDGLVLECADERTTTRPKVMLPEAAGVHDILFLGVKAPALLSILPWCRRAMAAGTRIVPLVNGIPFWYFADRPVPGRVEAIDPTGALLSSLPAEHVIGAVVFLRAEVRDDGTIASQGGERLILGHVTAAARIEIGDVAALLQTSGIDVQVSAAIRAELWSKVALNLATNPLSVAIGATLEQMFEDPALLAVVRPILCEVVALARALGVEPALGIEQMIAAGRSAGPFLTSMAQDHRMHRPLELAAIGGSVLELAAAADVPMAASTTIYSLVRWIERTRLSPV